MKAIDRSFDLWQTARDSLESGRELLRAHPAVPVLAECAGRLLLGVTLSAARVFDTYAPFALGFVAASGSGLGGFAALVGASLGYLTTLGLVSGLRYVSAAIFIYAVAFAFYDLAAYQKQWFMPLAGGIIGAVTGFLYLSELGWHRRDIVAFAAEVLLIAVSALLYRMALRPWTEPESVQDRRWTWAGLLYLGGTLAAAVRGITLFGAVGVGIALAAAGVLLLARRSGTEAVSAGVVLGLVLDLCGGGGGLYTGALAFGGLLAGAAREKKPLAFRSAVRLRRLRGGAVERSCGAAGGTGAGYGGSCGGGHCPSRPNPPRQGKRPPSPRSCHSGPSGAALSLLHQAAVTGQAHRAGGGLPDPL